MRTLGAASGVLAVAGCFFVAAFSQSLAQGQKYTACEPIGGKPSECVRPSATDPAITQFDHAHYVLANADTKPDAPLLLFLPGTGGEPPGPKALLAQAADAGYRVISLAYNDAVAVAVYCPKKPDPACSQKFRRMRIDGDGTLGDPAVDSTPADSIVNRLTKLLQYLDREHPAAGWAGYLDHGAPNWPRIIVCGQSQGAGMAAMIAKQHLVARAILFSSPWDYVQTGGRRDLAPWLTWPSKTPPDRWFGGYHARENMADLLGPSYAALKIPADHIRVFNADLPPGASSGDNPYHGQGIRNPAYAKDREFFLRAPAP